MLKRPYKYATHQFKKIPFFLILVILRPYHITYVPGGGGLALEYESDGFVPTGKRKQGSFGAGFRKGGVIGCGTPGVWDSKILGLLGVNFPKKGVIRCKFCQI